MSDFIDIGPECFTNSEETVISYKGSNFYKACGKFVRERDGEAFSCVKRVNHPGVVCEAFDGSMKRQEPKITLPEPTGQGSRVGDTDYG